MKAANTSRSSPGGQAGMRGYLVQTLIALLDGLKDGHPFVRVTLEPDHKSEKIDILWEYAQGRRAVQVKSSINQFAKADVQKWAEELRAQNPDTDCELCLVGLFHPALAKLDHVANVRLVKLNNDPLAFCEQAAHRLEGFLRAQKFPWGSDKYREMLADALTARLATLSTTGKPFRRDELIELLRTWVAETAETPKEPPQISPTHLRHGADRLVGREKELTRLDTAWLDPKTHVVTIVAWGGVGKTALVVEWMARMARDGWRGAERVFDWSFYSQGTREQGAASADTFIAKALEFFGDPEMAKSAASAWDKGSRLAQLVAQKRTLLVLDGVEPLQYPPGPVGGQLKDPALEALLKGLAQHNPGLCIVTTRESITDLKPYRDTTSPEWLLEHLSEEAGAYLLFETGVKRAGNAQIRADDKELKDAAREVGGHALTLQLLGRYLAKAHKGDVRKRDLGRFEKADAKVQGGHAFKVMAAYEKWLGKGGEDGLRQLAVLRLLGLFDRPADSRCLAALRKKPVIAALTKPLVGLNDDDWNYTLSNLAECGLISLHASDSPTTDYRQPATILDAHPLIREYFAKQLSEKNSEAWWAAHRRLYEHLCQTTGDQKPNPTLEDLQPLYQAVAHGCQARSYQDAFAGIYSRRIQRGDEDYYAWHTLGAFGSCLGALSYFFQDTWDHLQSLVPPSLRGAILFEVAECLRALGRLADARTAAGQSLSVSVKDEEWDQAAHSARLLSALELAHGEIGLAAQTAQEAVNHADASSSPYRQIQAHVTLGVVLHQSGQSDEASKELQIAGELLATRKSELGNRVCSTEPWQGSRFHDVRLSESEVVAWKQQLAIPFCRSRLLTVLERCREARRWSERTESSSSSPGRGYPHYAALRPLTGAHAAIYMNILEVSSNLGREQFGAIRQRVDIAIENLRRGGRMDYLPFGFLTRAWLRTLEDDADGARADLDDAWEIAERGPMRLQMADIHLYRARLFHAVTPYPWDKDEQGKPRGPKDDFTAARTLIEQCGYHRRDEELADAEQAAKSW
ncbi:MAG: ATP-binding protein [Phycisphaerae bacterium]|nr:ATP-binding protein [Phycisphaerae bacterium]